MNFVYGGLYDGPNETLTNEAWDAINFDAGSIALDDAYVESLGLPIAQRFPWDDTKGLYFLNAYHGVHCLVSILIAYISSPTLSVNPLTSPAISSPRYVRTSR